MLNFVWGRVGNPAASGFTLDDRSGTPVFVKTNAAAVSEGDYAEAEAVLHYSESGRFCWRPDVVALWSAEA